MDPAVVRNCIVIPRWVSKRRWQSLIPAPANALAAWNHHPARPAYRTRVWSSRRPSRRPQGRSAGGLYAQAMRTRIRSILAIGGLGLLCAAAAAGCAGEGSRASSDGAPSEELRACARPAMTAARRGPCYRRALAAARDELGPNCHNSLHAVGRADAAALKITPADIERVLPPRPDFDCGAGYVHGLMMGVALGLQTPADGVGFAAFCTRLDERASQQACLHGIGHVFMRAGEGDLQRSLELCLRLGPALRAGCAPGVFHDYWLGVARQDDAPSRAGGVTAVRQLCAGVPTPFVASCWFRSLGAQPPSPPVLDEATALKSCAGLDRVQRSGCLVGTSALAARAAGSGAADSAADGAGPEHRERRMTLCNGLADADAMACIQGAGVELMIEDRQESDLETIRSCELLTPQMQQQCYAWIGQLLAVRTNDRSARTVCPRLHAAAARSACSLGASRSGQAMGLV